LSDVCVFKKIKIEKIRPGGGEKLSAQVQFLTKIYEGGKL